MKYNLKEETLPTGKLYGVANEDYHRCKAISKSNIDDYEENPLKFEAEFLKGEWRESKSDELIIGSMHHVDMLEPQLFDELFIVRPEGLKKPTVSQLGAAKPSAKTIEQIEEWKAWEKKRGLKQEVPQEWVDVIRSMHKAALNNEIVRQVFEEPGIEFEVAWRVELENFYIQCKTDIFVPELSKDLVYDPDSLSGTIPAGEPLVMDLKKCASLSPVNRMSFKHSAVNHKYYRQEALYSMIINQVLGRSDMPQFLFAATPSFAPFETEVFCFEPFWKEVGRGECLTLLQRLENDLIHGFKGRPQNKAQMIEIPIWKMSEYEKNYPKMAGVA